MQKGIIKNVNKLTGEPIDAKDLASMLSGIIGNESGVLTVFDELRLEKISNNKVRLHSGVYSLKGHILYIPKGSYEDFEIESGTLGANRIDLLVAEYVKNGEGDGEDTLQFKIIKGESTSGQPQSPNLMQQDVNAGGITYQEKLYSLQLSGTDLKIINTYRKIKSNEKLDSKLQKFESEVKSKFDDISYVSDIKWESDKNGYRLFSDGTIEFWGVYWGATNAGGEIFFYVPGWSLFITDGIVTYSEIQNNPSPKTHWLKSFKNGYVVVRFFDTDGNRLINTSVAITYHGFSRWK